MPRGASPKRERQYQHIKESAKKSGRYKGRAAEVAARTINKIRADKGETKSAKSRTAGSKSRSRRSSGRAASTRPSSRRTSSSRPRRSRSRVGTSSSRAGAKASPSGARTPRTNGQRRRGFASMSEEKQRQIARLGGRAAHQQGTAHEFSSAEAREAGHKGGASVSRDRSHMAAIGRRGGES